MANIQLIIQRTFNGLDTVYSSPGFNYNDPQFKKVLTDERKDAAQIAHRSDVYSLSREKNFKVYSYINTSVVDIEKREGFFAVRLFVSSSENLENATEILLSISEKYKSYVQNNALGTQDYSDILNGILLQKETALTPSSKLIEGSYFLYVDNYEEVNKVLKKEAAFFVEKLYIFNKASTAQESSVAQQQFGMKPLLDVERRIKTITVNNTDSYLSNITINGNEMRIPSTPSFKLLLLNSDSVKYKTPDSKIEKDLLGTMLDVNRPKPVYVPPVYAQDSTGKPKGFGLGLLLAVSLGTLIIGGGLGWGGKHYFASKTIAGKDSEIEFLEKKKPLYFTVEQISGGFILDGKHIEDLKNYKFKYTASSQKWDFDEGYGSFKKLDSKTMEEIALNKNFNEHELIEALEKISGKKIDLSKENNSSQNTISAEISSEPDISSEKSTIEKPKEQIPVQSAPKPQPKPAAKPEVKKAGPSSGAPTSTTPKNEKSTRSKDETKSSIDKKLN